MPQLRLNHACVAEDCVVTSGDSVNVSANGVVDFRLCAPDESASPCHGPLPGLRSAAQGFRSITGPEAGSRMSSALRLDGTYAFDGLAGGTYLRQTDTQSGNSSSPEPARRAVRRAAVPDDPWWFVGCRVIDGAAITVGYAATTSAIDFSLERGGGICGHVADESGHGSRQRPRRGLFRRSRDGCRRYLLGRGTPSAGCHRAPIRFR